MQKRKFTLSTVEENEENNEENNERKKIVSLIKWLNFSHLRIFYRGHGKINEYKNVCNTIFKMI